MTSAAQGLNVTLTAQFFAYQGGPAADVSGLTITIYTPGDVIELGPTSSGITHPVTGVYRYTWAVPADAPLGDHIAVWNAAGGVQATEVITVTATPTATWCTTTDVFNLTGKTIDGAALLRAQAVIETYVDIDPADPGEIDVRDRERLRKALGYQAGWMASQIEYEARTDITNHSQDGESFTHQHAESGQLAPLAKRNIDRLSWNMSGRAGGAKFRNYSDLQAVEQAWLRDEVECVPGYPWNFESRGL